MAFKLVRKTIFEQTYNFCVIICFCFRWIYKSLRRKSDFILFCIFNYVTCINSPPILILNLSIGKFQSSRRRRSYQYHLMCN